MTTAMDVQKMDSATNQPERTRGGQSFLPRVDILEREGELLLLADVPGARAEDIDINYERGILSIHARVSPREPESRPEYLLREYGVGDFHREFQLGETIDASAIAAEVSAGVLTLHLPKVAEARARRIAVKTSG